MNELHCYLIFNVSDSETVVLIPATLSAILVCTMVMLVLIVVLIVVRIRFKKRKSKTWAATIAIRTAEGIHNDGDAQENL